MKVEHWMTFATFAEQDYFSYPKKDTYDGIVVNANMVAHAPDGLAAFLLEKTDGRPYIIDPVTHAFQHDPSAVKNSEGKVRKSIRTLSEKYGGAVSNHVGARPVTADDFPTATLREFVVNCLGFQRDALSVPMEGAPANKYLGQSAEQCQPQALVAPYFYLDEACFDQWLPVNIASAAIAVENARNAQILAAVVLSKSVLNNPAALARVVEQYTALPVSGYLVWVDELDEHSAGSILLKQLRHLGLSLRAGGTRSVLSLHGGYFSILAGSDAGGGAFSGVAHGPEFGEVRAVVPVGGGIPIPRYYIPELHRRVKYREALQLFASEGWLEDAASFHAAVCECTECLATIAGNPKNFVKFGESTAVTVRRKSGFVRLDYPTPEAKEHCLKHYLQRKDREYKAASSQSAAVLRDDLKSGHAKYKALLGAEEVSHLEIWRRIFAGE
jgi:hypothetical protein